MELTVLGNFGPYSTKEGNASGYLVQNGADFLVMDMGSGTLGALQTAVDVCKVKYLYISHLHYDHTSDLLPFRYLLEDLGHTVTVFTHEEDTAWYNLLFHHPQLQIVPIDAQSEVQAGSMRLSFSEMRHTVPDYAVTVHGGKTLCYTGDTLYNDNIPRCFAESDAVLLDCTKPQGFTGPHMTVADARRLANEYPEVHLFATHRSAEYNPTGDLADCKNITVVKTGKVYSL